MIREFNKEDILNINSSLMLDLYELAMACSYWQHNHNPVATFDLFIRTSPKNRNFFIVAGLQDVLAYLQNFNFSDSSVLSLSKTYSFPPEFLDFLKCLSFTGDVWAMPEGSIFFPEEPILRLTAPLIEAQLVESFLLNTYNLQVTLATKASRIVQAAEDKDVWDFSLRRTQGIDASLKASRCSYLAGCKGTSNVLAGVLYNVPVTGTMSHSFVMSFPTELDAFYKFSDTFPDRSILLIDTYNISKGVENAIDVALQLRKKGHSLIGLRIDSGNLVLESKKVRKELDKNGLSTVKIIASGDLNEYKIDKLIKLRAPIDAFGVGTHMGVSVDYPYSDIVYKISEVSDGEDQFLPTMKLSQDKRTYPGRKQVFRIAGKKGMMVKDIVALEDEKYNGMPLLINVIRKGCRVYNPPPIEQIKQLCMDNILRLPKKYKDVNKKEVYPVERSRDLLRLTEDISRTIKERSGLIQYREAG